MAGKAKQRLPGAIRATRRWRTIPPAEPEAGGRTREDGTTVGVSVAGELRARRAWWRRGARWRARGRQQRPGRHCRSSCPGYRARGCSRRHRWCRSGCRQRRSWRRRSRPSRQRSLPGLHCRRGRSRRAAARSDWADSRGGFEVADDGIAIVDERADLARRMGRSDVERRSALALS